MTELTITPKIADKTARFKGAVAAGEHVAVTIKGGAAWLGDDNGEHLSLRVLDLVTGRTLAVFPRPPETLEEGDEPDEWSTSAEDPNDLFCNLNLNTDRMVNAARHMLRVPVLFVMGAKDEDDPATTRTLYFRDRHEVEFWPERVGDDTPYDLDRWPKQIDEWTELVTDWNRRMNAMKLSAERVPRTESSVGKVTITLNDGNAETDTVVDVFDGVDGEVTPAQLEAAIAGVNDSIGDVASDLATHANNGDIHVTATQKAAWTAKYDRPSGGIPKTDLATAVQTSLGKADTALQEHQSLAAYVNAAGYDSNAKKILLKHDSATVAEIDATAFIKDGMVDGVEVSGGNLVISFNTDAGIEDIEIPLTDIFNPANYYDKTAADGRFVQKETGKGLFSGSYNDLTDKPTIPPAVTVDEALTNSGNNPVKSSGIWGAIWGALASLPFGFESLYDWCKSFFVHASAIAPKWDAGGTYRVGDVCVESEVPDSSGLLYRCKKAYTATSESNAPSNDTEHWELVDVTTLIASKQDALSSTQLTNIAAVPGKADAADLRYRIAEAGYDQQNDIYTLADRAVNLITAGSGTASIDIELPELANVGRMRDFYVRLTVSATSASTWTIGQGESWDAMGSPPSSFAAGTYLYHISEVAAGVWHCEDMFGVLNRIPMYQMVGVTPSNGTLTVTPYTVATYTAGDSAAAFTVAVGTGTSGVARDCELVIDCTATGAVAPTVTWPATFHPRTDAATDFACEAGKRNVYFISEYVTGEFAVGGWQETDGGNA